MATISLQRLLVLIIGNLNTFTMVLMLLILEATTLVAGVVGNRIIRTLLGILNNLG